MPANSFKSFVLDQLSALPEVRAKAMFGGHGLYQGKSFFGIIFQGRLYFKTDATSQRDYTAHGMGPFVYDMKGRRVTMSYHEVPTDILESRTDVITWANRAVQAAAKSKKRKT